jgi:hypothetical protein
MASEPNLSLKNLLEACAQGDRQARIRFQNLFGEIIYDCPVKRFHLPSDKAADFYIYVFDEDRIFRSVRGFEARNDAQFKTYLNFYVLRDLFLEWQRSLKEPETISLTTAVSDGSGDGSRTLEDLLADPGANADDSSDLAIEFKAFLDS